MDSKDSKEMEKQILDIFKAVLPKLSDKSLERILGFGEGLAMQIEKKRSD